MFRNSLLCWLMIGCLFHSACKKEDRDDGASSPTLLKTEKGIAVGSPVNKVIGSAGGEMTSADGRLTITVPAGAVNTNTEFSIQPITNTLFEDEGRTAYRLLPEGTSFARPVQLVFHYTNNDTVHTMEDLLTVASQRADGAWVVSPARLDKGSKTLTVQTTHFSDWTITGGLFLSAEKYQVKTGEKVKLQVYSVDMNANDSEIAPLVSVSGFTEEDKRKIESIDNWKIVSGTGGLTVESGQLGKLQYEAHYSAPSNPAANRVNVTISVDVKGYNMIRDPAAPGGVRQLNKMILFEHMVVIKQYMKGTLGGEAFEFVGDEVACELNNLGAMSFVGTKDNGFGVMIGVAAAGAGTYPCGVGSSAFITVLNPGSVPTYSISWYECNQLGVIHTTPAPVVVKKWPEAGGYAEGSFNGPLFQQDGNCGKREKILNLEYLILRSR